MKQGSLKEEKRVRRHKRVRARIVSHMNRPRLAVYRSNQYVYAQVIDDAQGKTLVAVDSRKMSGKTEMEKAKQVGQKIAELAQKEDIMDVVFDRGGFLYTGKVKALADGAREGGLKF